MRGIAQFIKTTLLGGAMFLLPLVLVFMLLREAIRHLAKAVHPIVKLLPAQAVGGIAIADIVAFLILLMIAFLAGLIAHTRAGAKLSGILEHMVLRKMPGFTLLKSITGQKGDASNSTATVALANIDDAWLFAFIMESHPNGMLTVFVPSAPTPTAGSLYFLQEEQVKRLDIPVSAAVKCIMQLGVGSRDLVKLHQSLNRVLPAS